MSTPMARTVRLLFWISLLLTLWLAWLSSHGVAQAGEDPTPADVRVEGDLTARRLLVGDVVAFQGVGVHVGHPQISPDGRLIAVSIIPAGTETADLAQIYLFDRESGAPMDRLPGHSPQWQDDRHLSFMRGERTGSYDRLGRQSQLDAFVAPPRGRTIPPAPTSISNAIYPQTIRVAHHPQNGCRKVADWQVDVIPFEEYVARSVPAETPVSWPIEALKAQAVAARTYAWYQIQQGRPTYDVTDWANFQMMCDDRYERSDRAVAQTAGHYLSAVGDPKHAPIIAMYSAKNGHPTLTHPTVAVLQAVPDWTGLGETRFGHGYGLSQWGAQRRAASGQSYRQILGHYYSGVNLQNALDPAQPLAGITGLEANGYLPGGGIRWRALTPATPLPGQLTIHTPTGPVTLNGSSGVWQRPWPISEGVPVSVSFWLNGSYQEEIWLTLDRTPPAPPTVNAPSSSEIPTATLSFAAGSEERIGLSNGWTWQGESLLASANMGMVMADGSADGGAARVAYPGQHQPGYWYGPYATGLPSKTSYRALFRLRMGAHPQRSVDGAVPDRPLARLDVTDKGGDLLLGVRDLWASDFGLDGAWVEIPVDFHLFVPAQGLEVRVQWYGEVELALDRVRVFALRAEGAQTAAWPLTGGESTTVTAVAFDRAGNVSAPVEHSIRLLDEHAPAFDAISWAQGWHTRLPITLTATVGDLGSGLETASGRLVIGEDSLPLTFENAANPWARQKVTAVLTSLADGQYPVRFRVADRRGNVRESEVATLRLDMGRPTAAIRALRADGSGIEAVDGWFGEAVQVEISGADAMSGLSALAYVLDNAPYALYTAPFGVASEGRHAVRYWAQDNAENYSFSQSFYFGIDRTPPDLALSYQRDADELVVKWQGTDALSGVAGYAVAVQRADEGWEDQQGVNPLAENLTLSLMNSQITAVRVRAWDAVGNLSEWQTQATDMFKHTLYLPQTERGVVSGD